MPLWEDDTDDARLLQELSAWLDKQGVPPGSIISRVEAYGSKCIRDMNDDKTTSDVLVGITPEAPPPVVLSDDQTMALAKINTWITGTEPYFILKGYSGTGKSFLLGMLAKQYPNIYFSATTNKAAKVVGNNIGKVAKTIHSLLGLKMVEDGENLVLKQGDHAPYFPPNSIIVIDEASMLGVELLKVIVSTQTKNRIRVIFVGDPAQLPPVGEDFSPAWRLTHQQDCRAQLRQVMRNDNALLDVATMIRSCILNHRWESPIYTDIREPSMQGVRVFRRESTFIDNLIQHMKEIGPQKVKMIAWRNKTVDRYNSLVRQAFGFNDPFCVGDIILLAAPIEREGALIAHTDDEYKVFSVDDDALEIEANSQVIKTWRIEAEGDQSLTLQVPKSPGRLSPVLSAMAGEARAAPGNLRKEKWREFWDAKRMFHPIRYGYALTAHRAQGSTYECVFLNQQDILANQNSKEAFKALYVAATRPSKNLYTF